jgi:hypothetical protein
MNQGQGGWRDTCISYFKANSAVSNAFCSFFSSSCNSLLRASSSFISGGRELLLLCRGDLKLLDVRRGGVAYEGGLTAVDAEGAGSVDEEDAGLRRGERNGAFREEVRRRRLGSRSSMFASCEGGSCHENGG